MSDAWREVRAVLRGDWTQPLPRDRSAVLAARAVRIARPLPESTSRAEEELHIRLGGAPATLPATAVRDVSPVGAITPIPGAPARLLGLARLRGGVVPVFDVGPALTGRPSQLGRASRLVTIDGPAGPDLVLAAEAVEDTRIQARRRLHAPPADAPPFLSGVAPDGAMALDATALLADPRWTLDDDPT